MYLSLRKYFDNLYFYTSPLLKVVYSEKATKIWDNLPLCFDITKKCQNKKWRILWPAHNIWTLICHSSYCNIKLYTTQFYFGNLLTIIFCSKFPKSGHCGKVRDQKITQVHTYLLKNCNSDTTKSCIKQKLLHSK